METPLNALVTARQIIDAAKAESSLLKRSYEESLKTQHAALLKKFELSVDTALKNLTAELQTELSNLQNKAKEYLEATINTVFEAVFGDALNSFPGYLESQVSKALLLLPQAIEFKLLVNPANTNLIANLTKSYPTTLVETPSLPLTTVEITTPNSRLVIDVSKYKKQIIETTAACSFFISHGEL